MKLYIRITADQPQVRSVLKMIAAQAHEVVEEPAAAELIVTDSPSEALGFLKEYEEVKVLIALQPVDRQRAESGANSLAKAYAGRVFIRPIVEFEGEENMVFFLTRSDPCEEVR